MEEGSNNSKSTTGSTATFYGWKYSHYFEILEEGSKTMSCTLCPRSKTLFSAHNTTSNFKTHLSRVHKKVSLVAKEVPPLSSGKRKKVDDNEKEVSQRNSAC